MTTFVRTFFMVFLMEIGSASNLTLAAIASNSGKFTQVWLGGILAMVVTCFLSAKLGHYMDRLPFSPDILSGILLLVMGLFFLFRSH